MIEARPQEDGDLHLNVRPAPRYMGLLNRANRDEGDVMVVEFMARDVGHLPRPDPGAKLTLVGALVVDLEHGWRELHPVWSVRIGTGRTRLSGPRFGGSPPTAVSEDAEERCERPSGEPCGGYGGENSGERPQPVHDPCGDFAKQSEAQQYYEARKSRGEDVSKLDPDGDGRACEDLPD